MIKLTTGALFTFAATFAIFVAACGGSSDDSAASGGDALSSASSSSDDGDAFSLRTADGSIKIAEVVLLHDPDAPPGDSADRLVASNTPGICDRIDGAYNMAKGEVLFGVSSAKGSTFTVGKLTMTLSTATAHAALIDQDTCDAGIGSLHLGGSVTISSIGSTLTGSMDLVANYVHLLGNFSTLKTCSGAAIVATQVKCPGD